jgi:hypothetical protein
MTEFELNISKKAKLKNPKSRGVHFKDMNRKLNSLSQYRTNDTNKTWYLIFQIE